MIEAKLPIGALGLDLDGVGPGHVAANPARLGRPEPGPCSQGMLPREVTRGHFVADTAPNLVVV